MSQLIDKNILLGISGGIAAYKTAELIRLLRQRQAKVRVVMTHAAQQFITPLTLQALSGEPVACDLFDPAQEAAMGHIQLARWADTIVLAPATADLLARLRIGMANDLLTTLCLASRAPLIVAPAMNNAMWEHPSTQDNIAVLRSRNAHILGPANGPQACGETGLGRMIEPVELCDFLQGFWRPACLSGLNVLISAGPTREPIDPVRYISNRSSGKMGFALATAAQRLGASVDLVSGPVSLATPAGVTRIDVQSAADMHAAIMQQVSHSDIFIAAAAVADYTPQTIAGTKLKKDNNKLILELTKTTDILAAIARAPSRPFTVGFAAETDDLEHYARDKLIRKNLDMIAANWVGRTRGGFEDEQNELYVYWHDGEKHLPFTSKQQLAYQLLQLISEHYHAQSRS